MKFRYRFLIFISGVILLFWMIKVDGAREKDAWRLWLLEGENNYQTYLINYLVDETLEQSNWIEVLRAQVNLLGDNVYGKNR